MVVEIHELENGQIIEWKWASDNKLIPSPFFTSLYYIDGILIDSGAPASEDELRDFVKSILKNGPIDKCVITHIHEDHSGGAHMLQEEFNIPIYSHPSAIPILKNEHHYPNYRQMTWGEKRLPVDAQPVNDIIYSSSKSYKFEVLHLPGHSPDLIALIEDSHQWVFASDAIQPKYKMIFGHQSDIQEDIKVVYHSIKKLYERVITMQKLRIFLSGVGTYTGADFLKERLVEIESLHQQVHQIYHNLEVEISNPNKLLKKTMKKVFGREGVVGKLTNGDLSIMNLIKSLKGWPLED